MGASKGASFLNIMKNTLLSRRTALLCTLATGGALMTALPAHAQFGGISEQEEIAAGRQASARAQKEYGRALSPNDPRQQRVSRIGQMFARQSQRENIPYSYTVLQNDKVLNAFAAPGGPIFVTTKLLSTAANDAELAYVLGHETGHIENKHIVKSVEKQQKVGLGIGILGAILGGGGGGNNIIGTVAGVGYNLWQSGYSRDQERDSDDYGTEAMARLGFDPRAAVSMLGKLGGSSGGLAKYLATHPSPESRQKLVSAQIAKDNLVQVAQQNGGAFLNLSGAGNTNTNYNNGYNAQPNRYSNVPTPSNAAPNRAGNGGTIGLQTVQSGQYRVVLASAQDMANLAGGSVEQRGRDIVVSRGNSYAVFTPGLKTANVNGRRISISAPMQRTNGQYFAPIGTLADALDGSATYDSNRRGIRLDFENGPNSFLAL